MTRTKVATNMYAINARKAVAKRIDNRLKKVRKGKRERLKELLVEYAVALKALNEYDQETIIAQELKRTTLKSYCQHGDKNCLSPTVILHYIRRNGVPLDVQSMDLTEQYGVPISEQDLIDFMNAHQNGRGSFRKFQELESVKDEIKAITGFNATPEFIKYLKVNFLKPSTFVKSEKQPGDPF